MAWILQKDGGWICYIHIPKTAGNWVRRATADVGPWTVKETFGFLKPSAHGMPDRWDYDIVFATVRDPMSWLGSAWGSRMVDGWRPHPERVPWSTFCALTDPYRSDDFEEWCYGVIDNVPGVVGWLFGAYIPPPARAIRLGSELNDFIREIGGEPNILPENVNHDYAVVPTSKLRRDVYEVEYSAYVKYGFKEDGSYESGI